MLRGTQPNTVGGLAHWIQTVYGESSSSDDTMWAACSSQNTNVPCESEKKQEKWVFHRNNLVNTVTAQRENTCVLPKSWHGAVRSLPGPYLVECKFNVALQRWRNAPWVRQETAKSDTNKIWVDNKNRRRWTAWCWDDSALLEEQPADTNTGEIVGISLELKPEIVFKVLRIRVKCQKGQQKTSLDWLREVNCQPESWIFLYL